MRAAAIAILAFACTSCVAPAATELRPVPFSANPPVPFAQAAAICQARAQAAAAQARASAQDQERANRYASPYSISAAGDMAANAAGQNAYAGCLAEQGWRLERVPK
jgi:hypothetical protein